MDKFALTLLLQAALTWVMVGIIWFIQVIHYPLYRQIHEGFAAYERKHLKRAAYLMGPVMLLEALTALILVGLAPTGILTKMATANLILLVLIWISTCLFQVQQHHKLSIRFSSKVHHLLISTNWVRTTLWTLRGGLIIWMISIFNLGG